MVTALAAYALLEIATLASCLQGVEVPELQKWSGPAGLACIDRSEEESNDERPESPSTTLPPIPVDPGQNPRAEALIDTSAVYKYRVVELMLAASLRSGVICSQVETELRANVSKYGLSYPNHPFVLVPDSADAVARAIIKQGYDGLPGTDKGDDGDIIIGATALSSGRTLYTSDPRLDAVVVKAGGKSVYVP